MDTIRYDTDKKTIDDIVRLYRDNKLDLEPGFQRQSVWNTSDRKKLIDSIVRNYPLPSVFFYKKQENGDLIYYVIDGKQRIESILMFLGEMRGKFEAKCLLPGAERPEQVSWKMLKRKQLQHLITGYKLPIIEVDGELATVIELFVRINSTGKALTGQEKRHAKYYKSDFLKLAAKQAGRFLKYFQAHGIMSDSQVSRMKHIELMSELILAAHNEEVSNKKAALDKIIEGGSITGKQLKKAIQRTSSAMGKLKRMFPKIKSTRLIKVSDFYSLAVLIQKFEREGLILTDKAKNRMAQEILLDLSNGVDKVRLQVKKAKGVKRGQELYRDYWTTVQEATDEINNRKNRERILRGLLESLFRKKDRERMFSPEQRRIIWNKTEEPRCKTCNEKLTWDDFTIDHVQPHSKGGLTDLRNAALMCRKDNSAKGNRKRR